MELLLELLPDPELGYEGTGTGGAGGGCGPAHVSTGCSPGPAHSHPAHDNPMPRTEAGQGPTPSPEEARQRTCARPLPPPPQSRCTKSAALEPQGPLGPTSWSSTGELVPPTSWGGAGRSPWGEGRHGRPRTLRELTLLHSSTGIKKGVMEKLICRRKVGPGLRRVRHQGSQGEGWAPTIPSRGPELQQALAPVLAASRQAQRETEPQLAALEHIWHPQYGPGPAPPTLPTVPSNAACCTSGGFSICAAGKGAVGTGKPTHLWSQGPWKLGLQDEGCRAKS